MTELDAFRLAFQALCAAAFVPVASRASDLDLPLTEIDLPVPVPVPAGLTSLFASLLVRLRPFDATYVRIGWHFTHACGGYNGQDIGCLRRTGSTWSWQLAADARTGSFAFDTAGTP